ncbi:hypothetical protein C6P45_003534 [Maudiozyma exigua]|uniref:MADS-box domain-containing protein n=1 Tax=Maudiozyma exigua TaxID=34358 RepID=A0A9P6WDW4_MAUEX|nr:hypothetical protein C6P45_003534 [Kazachstania exigua]
MGRRKIEIQPLTDERNRTVTFIKRKAGLLKKAHELAVLCQVDVTLLIVGPNNTLYEFSSCDTNDLIDHYLNDKTMSREIKGPQDFGNYVKNRQVNPQNLITDDQILSNDHIVKKRRLSMGNNTTITNGNSTYMSQNDSDDSDSTENASVNNTISNSTIIQNRNRSFTKSKHNTRSSNTLSSDTSYLSTSFRESSDRDIKNNLNNNNEVRGYGTLSSSSNQHIIRQQSDDNGNSNDHRALKNSPSKLHSEVPRTASEDNKINENMNILSPINEQQNQMTGSKSTHSSLPQIKTSNTSNNKSGARPVLRVEIPNNNIISNNAIYSEPSSSTTSVTTANIYGNGGSSTQYFKRTGNDGKPLPNANVKMESPVLGTGNSLSLDKNADSSRVPIKAPNSTTFSFSNGLPPLFSSTSAVPPYVATPLQGPTASGNNSNNPMNFSGNNSSSPIQPQMLPNQKQHIPLNQTQRYSQQAPFNPPQLGSGRIFSPTGGMGNLSKLGQDHMMNGPPTGSLPSKFANDLMMPSPSGSMSMFQDWSLGSGNNGLNNNNQQNNVGIGGSSLPNNQPGIPGANHTSNNGSTSASNQFASSSNGNTGLTPYINVSQTPLANRFFNFSSETANDDSGANNTIKTIKKDD